MQFLDNLEKRKFFSLALFLLFSSDQVCHLLVLLELAGIDQYYSENYIFLIFFLHCSCDPRKSSNSSSESCGQVLLLTFLDL